MKRIYYIMAALLFCAASINAQVRIGSNDDPHQGAILDLQSDETENKGILFPRVSLTALDNFSPVSGEATDGMVVYNINEELGKGLYIWDSEKWMKVSDGSGDDGKEPEVPEGFSFVIENDVYEKNYSNDYLTTALLPIGSGASSVLAHFKVTNKALYLYEEDASIGQMNWGSALNACSAAGGRLPNLYELAQLQMTQGAYGLRSDTYWSSTESDSSTALTWHFHMGVTGFNDKNDHIRYVRCVWSE